MSPKQLMAYFDRIAEAPGAVPRLRKFIISLAVRGKLVAQDVDAQESASNVTGAGRRAGQFTNKGAVSVANEPYELPNSWRWTTVQDVCEEIVDCPHSTPVFLPQGILCLDTNSFKQGALVGHKLRYVSSETYRERVRRLVPSAGDVVFAREGTVGESFVVPSDLQCCLGQRVMLFRPSSAIIPSFLSLSLSESSSLSRLMLLHKGMGAKHVNVADMRRARVGLPSVGEQHRILTKVDELMALCDRLEAAQAERERRRDGLTRAALAGKETFNSIRFALTNVATLVKSHNQLDVLRSSIYQLAFSGRLVSQDKNDESAEQLVARIAEQTVRRGRPTQLPEDDFEPPFAIRPGWRWVHFGMLIAGSDAGWSPQSESFARRGHNWGVLKVSAVSWDQFRPEENKQLLPDTVPPSNAQVQAGDFLISRANTSELVAKAVVVDGRPENLILSDKIVRLDIVPDANRRYLCMVNNHAEHARAYYAQKASGTSLSMKNVSRDVIYRLLVPLPPRAEQDRIVARVAQMLSICR